jgi:signal transduction histidine kinase
VPEQLAVLPEEKASFVVWGLATWLITIATALAVVVQRWNEPRLGRTILLVALAMLAVSIHDLLLGRVSWLQRVPQFLWYLPVIAAALGLVWYPTATDFAPFLFVIVTARAVVLGQIIDGIVVLLASAGAMIAVEAAGHFDGSLIWVLGIFFGFVGAYAVRSMLRLLAELKAAQAGLAERAAADERQRIAREVHDVIAHSLSVASLHITGARMAVRRSPEEATEALEQAEQLARDALNQVRSVIGVLSPSAEGTAPAMPTAADIPTLVAEFTDAGLPVVLDVQGDLGALSPAAGLALYRVTQESLSNVVRHAPGAPASVCIRAERDITLRVTNPLDNGASPTEWGRGIRGMRERAAAQGGTVDAGPRDGEWAVDLVMPAEGPQ